MIVLLLQIAISTLFFMSIYQLLLAKTALHKLKRIYLLLCLILPLSLPFIQLEINIQDQIAIPSDETVINNLVETFDQPPATISQPTNQELFAVSEEIISTKVPIETEVIKADYSLWLLSIYGLVVAILLIRYGISIYHILIRTKNARKVSFQHQTVIILDERTPPHNFLHFIFINVHDYEDQAIRESILLHELSHAREKHSLDILLVELLRIIFWFNPLYIFIGRAIRNNHEYLADRAVLSQFKNVSSYQRLLLGFAGQQFAGPKLASLSNYNLIKKRFIMMKHKTTKPAAFLRIALLIPLFLGSTAFFIIKPEGGKPIISLSAPTQLLPQDADSAIPDITPIDPNQYDYGIATGQMGVKDNDANAQNLFDQQWGIDYLGLPGTPVRATASGSVTAVQENDQRFGNFIKIRHNDSTETLYAKLGKLSVKTGQNINKGETIATIGEPTDIFGRVHYKIIVKERAVSFKTYWQLQQDTQKPNQEFYFQPLGAGSGSPFKERLEPTHFNKKLPDNLALENMLFDRKKVIIVKHSGESITKDASDLSLIQKRAILTIRNRPYRVLTRKNIPDHIVEKWDNFNYYKIWIDGKRVDNSEMSKYQPEDFAHYDFSSVLKHARNPSAFELYLSTPAYHAKNKSDYTTRDKAWREQVGKLLKESGLI